MKRVLGILSWDDRLGGCSEPTLLERAEQGYAVAQAILGSMYYLGNGVTKDDEEAFKWYRKAADQGCSESIMIGGDS